MRKRHVTYSYFCDICNQDLKTLLPIKCQLCGKEVCQDCARYICSKSTPPPISGGSFMWSSCNHKEELTICKSCTDILKLSLQVAARGKSV